MDATVEDKAARALAAAHAFLARSPVPSSRRARSRSRERRETTTRDVDAGAMTTKTTKTTTTTTTRDAETRAIALERSESSNATRSRANDAVASEASTREAGGRVNVNLSAAFDSTTTTTTNEEEAEETVEEASVPVVDATPAIEDDETEVEDVEDAPRGEEARDETASTATREATLGFAAPGTPASVALELSSDSSDGEVVDSPNVREREVDEGEVTSAVKTMVVEKTEEDESSAEGVFDVAIRREREEKEASSPVAAALSEMSALREEVVRLREELDGARWSREALEARVVEAEKTAADARSKTLETALDPQNQLTPEQVAALRAEIEQVEYLKRLLARAEQMRNAARAETKKAREKHEQDLEIVRREVGAMDEEMANLRKRVKNDKAKIEAMERATIEAADEFATLYARQENTRRLLAAAFLVVLLLLVRLFMSGGAFVMKNMYQY